MDIDMTNPTVFFIVTTCLMPNNFEERKREYTNAIKSLINETKKYNTLETKIIIVENNGKRDTFLNSFEKTETNVKVVYTDNNKINTTNKGLKEMVDFLHILKNDQDIKDNDIVVKITGRYRVGDDCTFLNVLYNNYDKYDGYIRTSAFMYPSQTIKERDHFDCLSGLFGTRAKYFRNDLDYYVNNLKEYEWIEWIVIMIIQTNMTADRLKLFDYLGVWIKTAFMKEYSLF